MLANIVSPALTGDLVTVPADSLVLPLWHPDALLWGVLGRLPVAECSFIPLEPAALGSEGTIQYLGSLYTLLPAIQRSLPVTVGVLRDAPLDTQMRLAAQAVLRSPVHWVSEARAYHLLGELDPRAPSLLASSQGVRRRIRALLNAARLLELLGYVLPLSPYRVVSAVHPAIAVADPSFALRVLEASDRDGWTVRKAQAVVSVWWCRAIAAWKGALPAGLEARLAAHGVHLDIGSLANHFCRYCSLVSHLPFPLGDAGLFQVLEVLRA